MMPFFKRPPSVAGMHAGIALAWAAILYWTKRRDFK
jgi:hypothetical protein